ncbi:MAG: PAS domain S-box protein [Gemmatimonas sp.]|nr:PAS domain S-box protein [Gemmatimonas sp.]
MTPASHARRFDLSRAVNRLSEAILKGDSTPGALQDLVDIVGPAVDADRALIYDVRLSEHVAVGLCEWIQPDVTPTNDTYPLHLFSSAAQAIVESGQPLESSRDSVHPLLIRDGADTLLHGEMAIRRLLWYPFRPRQDGSYVLVLNRVRKDCGWSAVELEFVETAAKLVGLALMKLDLLRAGAETEAELRRSESRFRLFYDHTPSMFFTVDRAGIVQSVNHFALEHLGYAEADLVGHSVLSVVHSQDQEQVREHLEACFEGPGAVRTISFRKVCKEGRMIWVKETTRVAGEAGAEVALIVCEDVTESRAHQEAARRAEINSHDKDEFMAMLGHELRNPLSPIVTALEVLRGKGYDDRELELIDRQVAHLRRLVDDLLDISRITRGKVELNLERTEFAVIAARAAEIARPLFQLKQQILQTDIARRGLSVHADPSRLVQAFANLLTNAAKYSEAGKEVYFGAARIGERIIVQVRDEGEGIEPEMLERVFDLFVQRPQPVDRAQSGLGLGLTIVRNLITLHGGTVRAESAGPGKGTAVITELPAATGRSSGRIRHAIIDPTAHSMDADPTSSILIVDDNDDARKSLCSLLSLLGYQVDGAGDGPSALELAARIDPSIALIDIGLPGMDGYELARRLRRARPDGIRLVAVTGYGQPSDRARSRAAGFDAHLVKPVDLDTLRPYLDP